MEHVKPFPNQFECLAYVYIDNTVFKDNHYYNYLSLCGAFAASEPLPDQPVSTTDTSPTPPATPRNESGQNWLKSTQLLVPWDQSVQGSGLEKLVPSSIRFVSLCGSYGKLYDEETEEEYAVKHVHTLQITDFS